MAVLLSIGEFSRVTHLTVKTLRHYDEVGLLAPAQVDDNSGYRYYAAEQLPKAQVIRRLRALDMAVVDVKAVLAARDVAARNALIGKHLGMLEEKLERTRNAVESLRALLARKPEDLAVVHRTVPAARALAVRAVVDRTAIKTWWHGALAELHATMRAQRISALGPICGLYDPALFQRDRGEATVFATVDENARLGAVGRVEALTVPAAELAVIAHAGAHDDIDVAYGDLAQHVAEHEIGVEGLIREYYVRDPVTHPEPSAWLTEIGWPIFRSDSNR